MSFQFIKMNGLGNDFIVVADEDARFEPSQDQVRAIAGRDGPTGCDQLIAITRSDRAHARMRIWNADGGEVEHCGNAARCVAWLTMKALDIDQVRLDMPAGVLTARSEGAWRVQVDMGPPRLAWRDIPLAFELDTRDMGVAFDPRLSQPGCVSMGNPHVTFFVAEAATAPVEELGPIIEWHWLFPQRVNVGFAEIKARDRIRLRVWERGAGLTKACGTGACAALVAAHSSGLCDRTAAVEMDGGELDITWREGDDHILMTGPVSVEFSGYLPALEVLA